MSQPTGAPLELRPLEFGEILDRSIKIYFGNFKTIFLISVLLHLPLVLVQLALSNIQAGFDPNELAQNPEQLQAMLTDPGLILMGLLSLGTVIVQALILRPLLTGSVVFVASHSFLGGRPGLGDSLMAGLRKLLPLVVTGLLLGIAVVVGLVVLVVPAAITLNASPALGGLLMFLVVLAIIVGAIAVAVYTYLYPQVIMAEDIGYLAALSRSWKLVSGYFWRMLGLGIVFVLLTSVAGFVLQIPFMIMTFFDAFQSGLTGEPAGTMSAIAGVGGVLIQALLSPFTFLGATLAYYDLRMRKEGFDLEAMASWLGER